MTKEELRNSLWKLSFTASMSREYHSVLCSALWWIDRMLKIGIGVLAIMSLVYASVDTVSFQLSVVSVVLAFILNIIPIDRYERKFADLRRRWEDLRKQISQMELEAFGQTLDYRFVISSRGRLSDAKASPKLRDSLSNLVRIKHEIDADEPESARWLVRRCQVRENQRRWGPECRTGEEVRNRIAELIEQRDRQHAEVLVSTESD